METIATREERTGELMRKTEPFLKVKREYHLNKQKWRGGGKIGRWRGGWGGLVGGRQQHFRATALICK